MKFWQSYSLFYSVLNKLMPYQEHVRAVLDPLGFKNSGFYLDVGCGTGNLIGNRPNIVGLDISSSMLYFARSVNRTAHFVNADLDKDFPFRDCVFDGAYCSNVLAYLKRPEEVLRNVHRVLKQESIFVVATLRPGFDPIYILREHLRRTSWLVLFQYFFIILVILFLNISIVRKLRNGTYHGFELNSLVSLLKRCGFEVVKSQLSYADQDVLVVARRK